MRKIIVILALALLMVSIGSASATDNVTSDNTTNISKFMVLNQLDDSNNLSNAQVTISGAVSDCITGKPFPGVTVKVKTLYGKEMAQTTTGQNGLYNVSFFSNETKFNVIAAYSGHLSPYQQVSPNFNASTGTKNALANFRLGQPSVSIGSPGETFINEDFSLRVTFDNPSSTTGFGPIVQLSLPSQITFNSASYLGNSIKTYDLGIFTASGQIYNPLTRQMVNGTPGYRLIILEYPFGSFTPDQPAAPVTVNARMAANATLGVPLNITATPVFRFGDDPLDNPSTDPPIFGPSVNGTVTPTVMRLTKRAIIHEDETATGPNYPVTYQLDLDIATGAVVSNVNITDLLSSNLQFLNIINAAGGTVINTPGATSPGGNITINFASITGVAGIDRTIQYRVYAPEFNSTNQTIINNVTGAFNFGPNDSLATGNYSNQTVTANGPSTNYNITLKSLAVQKSVTDINGTNVKPTDILQYTIGFQLSDYFELKNLVFTDVVGDGQSFLASFIPYLIINENGTSNNLTFNSSNYIVTHNNATGTWTIIFNVSQQMIDSGLDGVLTGGLYSNRTVNLGAATGTLVFRTVIDIFYEDPVNFPSGDPFLTSNDPTTNSVTGAGVLTNSNNTVTDGSGTSIRIVAPIIEKKLYAINGNTTNLTNLIKPGDKLTFSLKVVVPTTNLENFSIRDFLPIPFLNATQVMVNIAQGDTPPDVGQWCLASDDTLSSFLGRLPTLNTSALDNTITFNYGLVNSTDQNSRVAHILFTVNATNNPMADELYLTNLMNIMYDNSPGAMFTDNTIISFITQQPVLNITKGISNTTGAGTIIPSPTILPVNGNLTGANAGDKLIFVITIGNQGHWNAYNTIIKDNVLAGFVNFNLISVTFGNGTPIAYSGNLTNGTGLIINQIIPANATVLITYTVDVASNVFPRQIINNTAQITNYSSTDGGPNYVQDQSLFQDQARVTIADPLISKNLVNSTDPGTTGNNLTIGEQGTFRITVTLPEGQIQNLNITDILPLGITYVGNTINITGFNGTLAGFNGTSGNLIINTSGNNINFLFQGISTIMGDNNNTTDTFYINILTTVLNNVTSNPVTNLALPKTNNASINWDNNPGSPITTSYNFNVVQPQLNISKTITPNPAVGGQLVTVRFNVNNVGLSPAYNITITDPLNGTAFNWTTVVANSTPTGFTYNYNPATGIVTYTGGTLLAGQNAIFTFNVTLMNNIISNSSYNNSVTSNYDSLNITTTPRDQNRNYTVTNSTLLRTVAPAISKSIYSTSENDSSSNNVLIGEVVTYRIDIRVPVGVTLNLTIRDILINGLAYIPGRSFISRSSTNVIASNFAFTSLNLTDFQNIIETSNINNNVAFFLGNVTNSNSTGGNETISLLLSVVVRNNNTNIANRTLRNNATVEFLNASGTNRSIISNNSDVVVRLPNLSISKNASTTTPQGNESITFTIVVRNTNGAMAPVYDGLITDLLDANFLNVRNIVVTNSTPININQTFNSTTGNLTVTFDKLPVNQNLTITFVADLKQNITFNQTTTNRVNVTGTSLPGPNGSGGQTPGAPGTDTGKRTGDPTMPAGAVNNINATALVNITARSPTINKTSGGSKNVTRTIGATAPQTIVVTIPTGTTNRLRITDLIPPGLSVNGGAAGFIYSIGSNLSVQNSNPTATFNTSTNTWEFNFAQVNATQFSNITIDYNVTVLNVIGNQNGVNLTNIATVYYQNTTGEVNGGSSNTTTRVIEPDLQITKNASTNIKPGDVCTFTLNISHRASSTSDAYDLTIVDNIPAGMTYLNIVSLPGLWTADVTQLPGRIIFNGPALLMGQNATIIFTCTVNNNTALAGTNITNLANLTYSSLNGTNPNERNYNTTGSSITHILGADIFVTKTSPATIYAGQQINFTITVGNRGPDTAVNVVINDLIDPTWFARMNNVQYQLNGTWYSFNNPLNLNLGNISSLTNLTILIRGNVNSSAPVGVLNNSVNVTTDTPDPVLGNNSAQTSTTVQQLADIVIDKTGPATVIAGNNISYSILVTNNGPSDAQNVHVDDSIPVQLINAIYSINGGSTWLSWPVGGIDMGTIVSGSSRTILINATVPSSVLNGTLLSNVANATTTTPDPTPANDTVNTTVNTQADIYVTKSAPATAVAGSDVIIYTINVGNKGPSVARNVVLMDLISGFIINPAYSINNGTSWNAWNGTLNMGNLTPGSLTEILIQGLLSSNATGIINNTALVNTTTTDPVLVNNTASALTNVTTLADVYVTKSGPVSAVAGQDTITYTILVGNNGPSVARNVMVNDTIGFLSGVQYSLNGGSWNAWVGSLSVGNLTPGNVTTLLIRGLVPASALGTLNNTVSVNSTTTDPYLVNNTASALTNVTTSADIYVTKSAPVSVIAGQSITYNLVVGNVGPSVARNVNLYDVLAAEILNSQYSLNNGTTWVNWTGSLVMGDMNPGSVINLLIRGNTSAASLGTINNTATVNSTTTDPYLVNNTASTSTSVSTVADVFVTKSGTPVAVAGWDNVTYTLSVGNVGPSVARDVVLSDVISAMILNPFYSTNGGTSWNVWNGTLYVGDLNPGDSLQVLVRGNLSENAMGTINNTAVVNSTTFDPFLTNNTASALTNVTTLADIFVTKFGPVSAVAGQDTIIYTIWVGNVGPSVARDVLVDDPVGFLSGVEYSLNGGIWNTWSGSLSLGDLSSGNVSTLLIRGLVPASALGTLNNTVSVNSTTSDPSVDNNTASVLTNVSTVADVFVTKSGTPVAVAGWDNVTYNLSVGNVGPSVARDVVLTDVVPVMVLNPLFSVDGGVNWNVWNGSLDVGDLNPGSVWNILISGNLSAAALDTLNNTAVVNSTTFDPFLTNNTASALTNVSTVADVFVTKSGTPVAVAGWDNVTYTLSVGNVGPSVARDVVLSDIISGFIISPLYSRDNGSSWNSWNGSLDVGNLNPGTAVDILIQGLLSSDAMGVINNTAVVNSTTFDPYLANNTASALTNVSTVADVFVTKFGPVSAVAGQDTIIYTIWVGNVGPSVARNVMVNDTIGFLSGVQYSLNGGVWNAWAGSLLLGDLSSGNVSTLLIRGLVPASALGTLNNTVSVNSTTNDPFVDNNTASALTNVTTEADIYVIKKGPAMAIPGKDFITYIINVGNNGPSYARDVVLTDSIPSVILNPIYSINNGSSWNNWTGNLSLGDITPGSVLEILIRGYLSSSATQAFNNTAMVNSSTTDPFMDNNTSTAEVLIKTADIAVIKAVNVSNPKYLTNVAFTIRATNNGPDGATGVQIKDILPAGLKFISYTSTQGTYNPTTGIWNVGSINNGSYVLLRIVSQVIKSNTVIVNTATKYAENEYDPNPDNDKGNASINVAAAADLVIKKTVNTKSTYLTKKVYFTVTVHNYGPDTANGVYVKDILPKSLKFKSFSTNYGKYNAKTGIWTIGNLGSKKTAKLTIVSYAVRTGTIVNTATVYSKTYDPVVRPGDSKVSRATVVVKKIKRKKHFKPRVKTVGMQHTM